MDKIYRCTVICTFRVKENLVEYIPPAGGSPTAFKRPNEEMIRPIIGLEVTDKNDSHYKNVVSQTGMAMIGFDDLEYDVSDFEEDESGSEKLENEEYEVMPIENVPANLEPRFESTRVIIERRLREKK